MNHTLVNSYIRLLPYIEEDYKGDTVILTDKNDKHPKEVFNTINEFAKYEIDFRLPATHIEYQTIHTGKTKTTKFKLDSDYQYGFKLLGKRVYKGLDVLWTQSDAHKASKYYEDIEELNPSFITVDNPCMYEYTWVQKVSKTGNNSYSNGKIVPEKVAIIAVPENQQEYEQMLMDLGVSKF